jgi:hypothetical protein
MIIIIIIVFTTVAPPSSSAKANIKSQIEIRQNQNQQIKQKTKPNTVHFAKSAKFNSTAAKALTPVAILLFMIAVAPALKPIRAS